MSIWKDILEKQVLDSYVNKDDAEEQLWFPSACLTFSTHTQKYFDWNEMISFHFYNSLLVQAVLWTVCELKLKNPKDTTWQNVVPESVSVCKNNKCWHK